MSHILYDTQWQLAIENLTDLINTENPPIDEVNGIAPAQKSITTEEAYVHFAVLYIKYIQVLRKLTDCYDQIVHPQKRIDIRNALDTVMARLCQTKHELVRFNPHLHSDCISLDDYLLDLKLSPSDLEIPIPLHFREDDSGARQAHMDVIDAAYETHNIPYQEDDTADIKKVTEMLVEQAVKMIQTHERGRQGITRAKIMKDLREDDLSRRRADYDASAASRQDPVRAAINIQRVFRGYMARQRVQAEANDELVFIGIIPRKKEEVNAEVREAAIRQLRKTRQGQNEQQYRESLEDLKTVVKNAEGPDMKDVMRDERVKWWLKQKEEKGIMPDDFTDFYAPPAADENEDADVSAEAKDDKGKKKGGKDKAPAKAKEKAPAKGGKEKKKGGDAEEDGLEAKILSSMLIGPSGIVTDMRLCVDKYKTVWSVLDESENFQQRFDVPMAKQVVRPSVQEKVREEVDLALKDLLANMKQQALQQLEEESKGKKKTKAVKKSKSSKKKVDKSKKVKKEKCCDGLKQMKDEDTFSTMISEMVENHILQKLPRKFRDVSAFLGDLNYMGASYHAAEVAVDPSMAQLRSCLTEYAVLPLGSAYTKHNTPLVNSLLLYGPAGSGKSHLSKAIGCHTGAMWFELSPKILENYDLADKAVASRLVHIVFTLAEQMQPAVIYIDDIEKIFAKSKKTAGADYAKIKKDLISHRDLLTSEHRILIIGNSREPFEDSVEQDELCAFFSDAQNGKALFCPHPDYATRMRLWSTYISKKGLDVSTLRLNRGFDMGSLTQVSSGYTAGSIAQAVSSTLSSRRVQQILDGKRSFETTEFLSALSKTKCVYDDEYKKFQNFSEEISGERARKDAAKRALSGEDDGDKKAKKGEKKTKKK